jgi:BirA family biotin operon repressor/biotin-[acetyl-CoA-carboxylase] ligase
LSIQNTLFIGKVLLAFDELESTNTYGTELLSKTKPTEGTVISTFRQTAGRGQIGSRWESEPDRNLSFSILLYPTFLAPREQFLLSMTIALAVRTFIARYTEKMVTVKWPNDIYVGNRKICGILIQNATSTQSLQSSVVGIGVNVNQTQFSENAPNATSLALETGREFSLFELLQDLCQRVEQRYLQLKNAAGRAFLYEQYQSHLYRYNEPASFQRQDGSTFSGIITGVSDIGKLLVRTKHVVEAFDIKEIRFL